MTNETCVYCGQSSDDHECNHVFTTFDEYKQGIVSTRIVHLPAGQTPHDTIDALKVELAAKTAECEALRTHIAPNGVCMICLRENCSVMK